MGNLVPEGLGYFDTSLQLNLLGKEVPNSDGTTLSTTVVGDETILGRFDASQTPGDTSAANGNEVVTGTGISTEWTSI